MERWLVLTCIGVLLLVLGLAIPYGTFNRDVENTYWVDIAAPADVRWSLWLPMPLTPLDMRPQTSGVSLQETATDRGPFYNATGTGNASLAGSSRRFVFDVYPLEWKGERLELSGSESGGGFWVGRQSDDGTATISVSGASMWRASYLGGSIECGGPFYRGDASEGWTLLAQPMGDCVELIDGAPWLLVAAGCLGAGPVLLVTAAIVRRRAKGDGEQVFLPPLA